MAAALLLICNDAFVRREKAMQVFVKRVCNTAQTRMALRLLSMSSSQRQ